MLFLIGHSGQRLHHRSELFDHGPTSLRWLTDRQRRLRPSDGYESPPELMHTLAFIRPAGRARRARPRAAPSAEEQRLYDEGVRALQPRATHAPPSARSRPATRSAAIPRSWSTSARRRRRPARPREAAESYRRYLREAPDASDRADIETTAGAGSAPRRRRRREPGAAEPVGEFGAGDRAPPAPAPDAAAAPGRAPGVDTERRRQPRRTADDRAGTATT